MVQCRMDVNTFVYLDTSVQAKRKMGSGQAEYVVLTIGEDLTIFLNAGAERKIIEALNGTKGESA